MSELDIDSCTECKHIMKINNHYCYHPNKYGTKLEDYPAVPDWCPLKNK